MDIRTYNEIKRRIKSIKLNNGYQYDDLCHDTVEKLLLSNKSDKDCIRLCFIVALNLIRDYHRKNNRLETIKLYDLKSEPIEPEEIKINEPIKYKHLYVLRYKIGMKYKEISEHLNIPIGTVKGQIHKLHQELKDLNL